MMKLKLSSELNTSRIKDSELFNGAIERRFQAVVTANPAQSKIQVHLISEKMVGVDVTRIWERPEPEVDRGLESQPLGLTLPPKTPARARKPQTSTQLSQARSV